MSDTSALTTSVRFQSAEAVWPAGRRTVMNDFVGFRAAVDIPDRAQSVLLRLTASTVYRAFVDGVFLAHGPARAAHGHYRVDELPLRLPAGEHVVAIEVAGYNMNSYDVLDQPSFLQAEVVADGAVLAATAVNGAGFTAVDLPYRVRKTARYSFQRAASEAYRMDADSLAWRTASTLSAGLPCEACDTGVLLPRRVGYPDYRRHQPQRCIARGRVERNVPCAKPVKDRSLTGISSVFKGYPEDELETIPSLEVQHTRCHPISEDTLYDAQTPLPLAADTFASFDFSQEYTGFLRARVKVARPMRLWMVFDEILTAGDISATRIDIANIIAWNLAPGDYELESFEPYSLRYCKLMALDGGCTIHQVGLREYANSQPCATFASSDNGLNRIYAAAVETLRQNSVDLLTDCPSRERAGWLCDSYFSGRAAFDLFGDTTVETAFLENFLLADNVPGNPAGMFPMCYPADHNDGNFIPQWAMWLLLELEEYLGRSGDRALVEAFRPKVEALLGYFEPFHNRDGLLEKLPGWNFIEWSAANEFIRDVNYPTNMLWAAALDAVARVYARPELSARAAAVRDTVRRQAWDGEFFIDNAVYAADGTLQPTRNRTEVCQYYAFYFGLATPRTHARLWERLATEFGPRRRTVNPYPEIHFANAIVGNYLRLELLSRHGRTRQVAEEMNGFFLTMAETTGTLWEHTDQRASCNHGFAAHVIRWITRDVLGIERIDPTTRTITLRRVVTVPQWCRATLPVGNQWFTLDWDEASGAMPRFSAPEGYCVIVPADAKSQGNDPTTV